MTTPATSELARRRAALAEALRIHDGLVQYQAILCGEIFRAASEHSAAVRSILMGQAAALGSSTLHHATPTTAAEPGPDGQAQGRAETRPGAAHGARRALRANA